MCPEIIWTRNRKIGLGGNKTSQRHVNEIHIGIQHIFGSNRYDIRRFNIEIKGMKIHHQESGETVTRPGDVSISDILNRVIHITGVKMADKSHMRLYDYVDGYNGCMCTMKNILQQHK